MKKNQIWIKTLLTGPNYKGLRIFTDYFQIIKLIF